MHQSSLSVNAKNPQTNPVFRKEISQQNMHFRPPLVIPHVDVSFLEHSHAGIAQRLCYHVTKDSTCIFHFSLRLISVYNSNES